MRGIATVLTVLLCINYAHAQKKQQQQLYEKQGGNLSTGLRGTLSGFSHGGKEVGYGVGGHFRLQIVDRVNTEWYADVLTSNLYGIAHRWDYHIGWSVMYYILHPHGFKRKITPYIVAGHCFDHTRIALNGQPETAKARWSSAVQMGAGMHYNITPKFDISLTTQYMLHLGNELHAHMEENGELEIETHKNAGWEGHLLISLSVNYKLFKLWKPRK
jgi:opacity protein-like surface antigen